MKFQALALLLATAVVGLLAETYIDNAHACSDDLQYESVTVRESENPIGEIVR